MLQIKRSAASLGIRIFVFRYIKSIGNIHLLTGIYYRKSGNGENCCMKKKKKSKAKTIAGWVIFLLVLALVLLTVFKPDMVGSFLNVLGKGGGKIRLTSAAEHFYDSMDDLIVGLVLPKGEDPTLMTVVKSLGADVVGLIITFILGSAISEKLDTSYGAGLFLAYLPCTAAVFLVNGIGISNLYLMVSVIVLVVVSIFGER